MAKGTPMKRFAAAGLLCSILALATSVAAQDASKAKPEPTREQTGAPLPPRSIRLRR